MSQTYGLLVNDEEKVTNARLQRADHEGNSTFSLYTFFDATLTYANIDDIVIDDTAELPSVMQTWGLSGSGVNGTIRIDDIQSVVGPVR
jgi:hypothetical protein